jgi:5-methylcytosine-specific restriction protein A
MKRREFPKAVRLSAWERSGGRCEACTVKIVGGNGPHYDHVLPDALGGEPTLENCAVLCKTCHAVKTTDHDRPHIDKARRGHEKRIGARVKQSRPMPGSRASGWRRRMDGTMERR